MAGGAVSILRGTREHCNTAPVIAGDCRSSSYSQNAPNFTLTSHSKALLQGLNALRCADKLFDVTLVVEDKIFKAHRVVLAACSDYFCAMFTDAMREARQSEIKLNGVNARGIELLIDYAYTSKLELDQNNVQDVLSVSTHVQMKAVIEACSSYLESQIDLENCVAIAALADLYALDTLKWKTYRFICSRFNEFSRTTDLINLSWDQLEYILSCNYHVDCSEERVLQITVQYCIETYLKTDLAKLLFARIRFRQIEPSALTNFLNILESRGTGNDVYVKLLQTEISKQLEQMSNKSAGIDEAEEVIPTDILINSRGMELALVKIGGFETSGLTNHISCYLPSVGKWEDLTVIPHIEQCNYGTAVLGNNLYIVGVPRDVSSKPFGFHYCSIKDKWRTIAPIQAYRVRFSLNAMGNDYLYAVGGVDDMGDDDRPVSNCERYSAKTDRWEYLPALIENRRQHAGVILGDKLFISGGIEIVRDVVLASLWCFDTRSEQWNQLCPMPIPRADHILLAVDEHIYACGGWYKDPITRRHVLVETIDVYDPAKGGWSTETINPMPTHYTGITAIKKRVYFIGHELEPNNINTVTTAIQCYDLDTKQWSFNVRCTYPKEVFGCTLAAFYVPRKRD